MRTQPSPSPMKSLIKNPPPISPIPVSLRKPQLFHSSPTPQQQPLVLMKPNNRAAGLWWPGASGGGGPVPWVVVGQCLGWWWTSASGSGRWWWLVPQGDFQDRHAHGLSCVPLTGNDENTFAVCTCTSPSLRQYVVYHWSYQ